MLTEILVILTTLWALGIPVFMYSFKELIKDDPRANDMLSMNPFGLVLLSAAIVCWPAILLMRMIRR